MKWDNLLALLGSQTTFESSQLLSGPDAPEEIRRQLSRWSAGGRLIQLRRGLYALAPPFARQVPHPFAVAGRLVRPSYVSLASALAYHGLIPESVARVTSVTTRRPARISNALGAFVFRHVQRAFLSHYVQAEVAPGQVAFVAEPEKALLDLYYLTPGTIDEAFVTELRLDASGIDPARLMAIAAHMGKPRLIAAAAVTCDLLQSQRRGEREL